MALEVADFDRETGALQVRQGKGRKFCTVYLPPGAIAAVKAWLEVRGDEPGALLGAVRRGGHVKFKAMTDQAVMVILRKRGEQARVAAFSPHDFRRTLISNLLEAGADVLTVSRLAGHSNPATS